MIHQFKIKNKHERKSCTERCANCDADHAIFWCFSCECALCEDCDAKIHSIKIFSGHRRVFFDKKIYSDGLKIKGRRSIDEITPILESAGLSAEQSTKLLRNHEEIQELSLLYDSQRDGTTEESWQNKIIQQSPLIFICMKNTV